MEFIKFSFACNFCECLSYIDLEKNYILKKINKFNKITCKYFLIYFLLYKPRNLIQDLLKGIFLNIKYKFSLLSICLNSRHIL